MDDVVQNYELAYKDYKNGMKYKDIATKYGVTLNTVKSWKTRYKWTKDKKGVHTNTEKVCTQKGAQPKNKNAESHGLFSKYLPQETLDIVNQMSMNPLDILWDQIKISYAAIIRAQQIMYVKDRDDSTTTKVGEKMGAIVEERWEVQHAWDKQAAFLQSQARAQAELRSLIKQYDELLHKNWDLVTEEQQTRIAALKAQTDKINKGNNVESGNADMGLLGDFVRVIEEFKHPQDSE